MKKSKDRMDDNRDKKIEENAQMYKALTERIHTLDLRLVECIATVKMLTEKIDKFTRLKEDYNVLFRRIELIENQIKEATCKDG